MKKWNSQYANQHSVLANQQSDQSSYSSNNENESKRNDPQPNSLPISNMLSSPNQSFNQALNTSSSRITYDNSSSSNGIGRGGRGGRGRGRGGRARGRGGRVRGGNSRESNRRNSVSNGIFAPNTDVMDVDDDQESGYQAPELPNGNPQFARRSSSNYSSDGEQENIRRERRRERRHEEERGSRSHSVSFVNSPWPAFSINDYNNTSRRSQRLWIKDMQKLVKTFGKALQN